MRTRAHSGTRHAADEPESEPEPESVFGPLIHIGLPPSSESELRLWYVGRARPPAPPADLGARSRSHRPAALLHSPLSMARANPKEPAPGPGPVGAAGPRGRRGPHRNMRSHSGGPRLPCPPCSAAHGASSAGVLGGDVHGRAAAQAEPEPGRCGIARGCAGRGLHSEEQTATGPTRSAGQRRRHRAGEPGAGGNRLGRAGGRA
jgi:hypothetical protein